MSLVRTRLRRASLLLMAAGAAIGAVACGGEEGQAPPTTAPVSLTTDPGADPAATGRQILLAAGARDAVAEGAEPNLTELAENWCTTALRSDVENADATFRFALNDFFTEWGVVTSAGEVQDVPLAKAMLAGTYAEPLAAAANEVVCPEVDRAGS